MCRAVRAERRPSFDSCSIRELRTFTSANSAATKKPFRSAKKSVARSRHATPKKSSEGWTSVNAAPLRGRRYRGADPAASHSRAPASLAVCGRRRRALVSAARAQVQRLDEQRERHRRVHVTLRDVLIERL